MWFWRFYWKNNCERDNKKNFLKGLFETEEKILSVFFNKIQCLKFFLLGFFLLSNFSNYWKISNFLNFTRKFYILLRSMIFKHREVSILLCLMFIISLSSSSLIELTNTTFSSYISSNERTFLYFYSPSCKYCHLLEPEIKKLPDLVEKLGIEGSSITFARVDGN